MHRGLEIIFQNEQLSKWSHVNFLLQLNGRLGVGSLTLKCKQFGYVHEMPKWSIAKTKKKNIKNYNIKRQYLILKKCKNQKK